MSGRYRLLSERPTLAEWVLFGSLVSAAAVGFLAWVARLV